MDGWIHSRPGSSHASSSLSFDRPYVTAFLTPPLAVCSSARLLTPSKQPIPFSASFTRPPTKMAAMRFVAAVLAALLALLSAPGAEAPLISFAVPGVPSLRQGPRAGRAADDSPSVDPAPSQDETKPAPMGSGEVVTAMKEIAAGDHQDREAEPPSRMAEHLMADGGGGGGGVVVGAAAAAAAAETTVESENDKQQQQQQQQTQRDTEDADNGASPCMKLY